MPSSPKVRAGTRLIGTIRGELESLTVVERSAQRVRALAARLLAVRRPSARVERMLLVVAALAMLAASVAVVQDGHLDLRTIRWAPLLVAAVVGVPLTAVTNAAEYRVSARAVGATVTPLAALRTTVLATAANLLPLPGGPIVRIQALRAEGVATGVSTQVTAAVGASWLAIASLLAVGGGMVAGASAVGLVPLAVFGSITAVAAGALLRRAVAVPARWRSVATQLVVIEVVSVAVSAARLALLLVALGVPATIGPALVLALAGVLATAVGIVPAGLGVREALSSLLAVAVALPAATGFAVSLLDRVVGLAVAAPLAGVLSVTTPERSTT